MPDRREPETAEEAFAELRESCLDFVYALTKALGLHRLWFGRWGLTPKPWVRERQIRDEWERP